LKPDQTRYTSVEEERLIRQAIKGNEAALDALFRRHLNVLYQSALKLLGSPEEAEDALQEGMLSAFRNLPRFEGRSQFSTWLTRIVINAALMRLRAQRARQFVSADDPIGDTDLTLSEQLTDPSPNPEQRFAQEELRALVSENLTELSPDMQKALVLRDLEGFSTTEAAEAIGVTENTLKSRLHRARQQLSNRVRSKSKGSPKSADKVAQGGLSLRPCESC